MLRLKWCSVSFVLLIVFLSLVTFSFTGQKPETYSIAYANSSTFDSQVPWWDESWSYRWPINIASHSVNDVYDYQVCVMLNSSNFDFSKAKEDGSDLRFIYYNATDKTQEKLNYWVESWSFSKRKASIWVKVTYIPAGRNITVYIYYGNSKSTSTGNFDEVFTKNYEEEGLTSLWHLDEGYGTTVYDNSNNNNDGTIHGARWIGSDGGRWDDREGIKFSTGDSLQFDGEDDYVKIPNSPSLWPSPNITIEFWVKPTAYDKIFIYGKAWAETPVVITLNPGTTKDLWIKINNNFPEHTLDWYSTGHNISLNEWHHIVVAVTGSQKIEAYVDLVKKERSLTFDPLDTSNSSLYLMWGTERGYASGIIDEVRIYSRALASKEVKAHYERRKYISPEPTVIIPPPPIDMEALQPVQGAILGGITEVFINVTSEAHRVAAMNLKIYNDSGLVYTIKLTSISITEWSSSWDTTEVSNGFYNLKAEVTTLSGDVRIFNLVDIEVKNIRLEVLKPQQGANLSKVTVFLINVTSGFERATAITLKVHNSSKPLYSLEMTKVSPTEWRTVWNTTEVPYGSYFIKAEVNVTLGSVQAFSLIEVVKPIPQIITELVKPNVTSLSGTVELVVNITSGVDRVTGLSLIVCKNSAVMYSIETVKISTTEWHVTLDTTTLPDGPYTIKAEVTTLTGDVQNFNLAQVWVRQGLWFKIITFFKEPVVLTFIVIMIIFTLWTFTLKEKGVPMETGKLKEDVSPTKNQVKMMISYKFT